MVQISKERFALGSYQYLRYPFEYFLDTAVLLGMQNVELWAAGPSFCLDTMDEAQLIEKAAQIRSRELSVCCITPEQCQYPVNLAAEDEKIREYSIRNFERAFYAAEILNCPKVLVSLDAVISTNQWRMRGSGAKMSLYRLSEKAQKMGILLVLETLTPLSSNVLNTPEQQKEMISLMPSGSMKPMLDIGQMVYMDQKIERYLAHGAELSHIHLHDSHPAVHMALGDGDLPICEYLDILESAGYKGMYALEQNDPRYRSNPRQADIQSIRWLKKHGIFD